MHPITLLLAFTLVAVLIFAIVELRSVRQSQRKRHETKEEGHRFGPSS